MKCVSCLLLVAATLAAQDASAVRRLNSTLLTLKDGASRSSVGQQLAADIASVADPDHRPSPKNIRQLADDLTASLSVGSLRVDLLSGVTTPIVEVLHSAGTSTVGFHESVSRAEKSLASLGVPAPQAKHIAESLRAIGMQVRGPEDTPVR
jgi:hypothetical protein